jgi:ssDNA-binding Zn-finger/Zn-ribbon topoisomerase 1
MAQRHDYIKFNYRLTADCPHCGSPLVQRRNRTTHDVFLGCSKYPRCAFTEPYAPHIQRLAQRLREVEARGATTTALSRELRRIVAITHPDKWYSHSGVEVAEEVTKAVRSLRERQEEGVL